MYTVSRGGYNARHVKPFVMSKPSGLKNYLFLIVKSAARFYIGEDQFDVASGCAIIISPGVPYQYHDLGEDYKNDWLYLQSKDPEFETKYGVLMNRPIKLGNTIQFTQYIQHILWEKNYATEKYRNVNVSMLIQTMLNKLLQENELSYPIQSYSPYASRLRELRLMMQSQPSRNYTPEELANLVGLSSSYFQFLYR